MSDLEQQAIDYSLGILPKNEADLFEAMLGNTPEVQSAYAKAQDSLSLVGLTSSPQAVSPDFRDRVLEASQRSQEIPRLNFLKDLNPAQLEGQRYNGGGGSVDLGDLRKLDFKDQINRLYEGLLLLTPLISGSSAAANGNLSELKVSLASLGLAFPEEQAFSSNGVSRNPNDPPAQSLLRSYLASLPSMGFFVNKICSQSGTVGDVRRLFYLCRDQKKIMRASFGDLDAPRLADDEELRLHGADLLRTKWWGAEHSYFGEAAKVRCGNFFDGPVTERCVEFAEYDSNLYCLANLLATRSSGNGFDIELFKDLAPNCVVALISAQITDECHSKLKELFDLDDKPLEKMTEDHYLANLVMASVSRAYHLCSPRDSLKANLMGCERNAEQTYLWFTWPNIDQGKGIN
tara:strand:+ start:105 stop:1316 length:1212 start_codon:yes stop_codon:yes gene_type:complete